MHYITYDCGFNITIMLKFLLTRGHGLGIMSSSRMGQATSLSIPLDRKKRLDSKKFLTLGST